VFAKQLNPQSLMVDQSPGYALSLFTRMEPYDLVFVLAAVAFNLLIAGIFIAQKKERHKLTRTFGITWLTLAIPLVIVFIHYLTVGRELWIMIYFGFIFLYMFVELLLDYILKIEFRQKKITHIPYIILEYIALFGFIGISFAIDRTWGFLVSISFWILLASLIYLYWGRKKVKDKK
jgi:hypothetical protein